MKEDLEKVEEMKAAMFGGAMSTLKNALISITNSPGPSTSTADQTGIAFGTDTGKITVQTQSSRADFGKINKGRRVDHALQESPLESINEYLFSVGSHSCYWSSEDCMLLIVKEIYDLDGTADLTVQQVQQVQAVEKKQDYAAAAWMPPSAAAVLNDRNIEIARSFLSTNMPKSMSFFSGISKYAANIPKLNKNN
jgi:hypothetical protein